MTIYAGGKHNYHLGVAGAGITSGGAITTENVFEGSQAAELDAKMDDGSVSAGRVQGFAVGSATAPSRHVYDMDFNNDGSIDVSACQGSELDSGGTPVDMFDTGGYGMFGQADWNNCLSQVVPNGGSYTENTVAGATTADPNISALAAGSYSAPVQVRVRAGF